MSKVINYVTSLLGMAFIVASLILMFRTEVNIILLLTGVGIGLFLMYFKNENMIREILLKIINYKTNEKGG